MLNLIMRELNFDLTFYPHLCPGLVELLYFVYSRNQNIYR